MSTEPTIVQLIVDDLTRTPVHFFPGETEFEILNQAVDRWDEKSIVTLSRSDLVKINEQAPDLETQNDLQTLWDSCNDAITGDWDKSDEGFVAMQDYIVKLSKRLGIKIRG